MKPRSQTSWLAACAVAYVSFAAGQAGGGLWAWLSLPTLPAALLFVWKHSARSEGNKQRSDSSALSALRACAWGAALWLAARSGPAGHAPFDATANLGAGAAAVAALVALARIAPRGGILSAPPATRSLDAAGFAAVLWGIAVAIPAARAIWSAEEVRYDVLAADYATTTAGVASLLILVVAAWRLRYLRRLELGVGDRASGALALSITAAAVAVPAAFFGDLAPDRLLPGAVVVASALCTWAAVTAEPTTVSGALRGILAIAILGAPVTLGASLLALKLPGHAGTIVLSVCPIAIGIGLVARAVARPLGPEQSRWLDAIDAASQGALQPEPDAAVRAALLALSRTSSTPGNRPELWRSSPEEVLSVDAAGYLHTKPAKAPARIYELGLAEPERTLRVETLRALEVRRPEVRPLVKWFDTHHAYSATLVLDDDGPLGFILLPQGNRRAPMTLEEARAIRALADRLSALFAVSSALARSRQRELAAVSRSDQLDDERQRLEHIIFQEAGRYRAFAEACARPIRTSSYSPAMQTTLEHVERAGRLGTPATLQVPPGVDPLGFAALLHLKSARNGGPFVVTDGASGSENTLQLWQDPETSPLRSADGGTLLIRDAGALPEAVQEYIVQSLSRQVSTPRRSSILPPGLVVTTALNSTAATTNPPTQATPLTTSQGLSPALKRWLGATLIQLPSLVERGEDMQALVLFHLTRIGLRLQAAPLGIEPAALRLLLDHTWPGNELELELVLQRAATSAKGGRLTLADFGASGFRADPGRASELAEVEAPASVRAVRRRRATRRRS